MRNTEQAAAPTIQTRNLCEVTEGTMEPDTFFVAETGGRLRRIPQSELMPYMEEATEAEIDALFT